MSGERSTRESILLNLLGEFRECGFDGVSLARISEVTGLRRASLYHHFPGGKGEMAEAVMALAANWLEDHVFRSLDGPGEPEARLAEVLAAFNAFYGEGTKSCLLDVMALRNQPGARAPVRRIFQRLVHGFEHLALDAGHSPEAARQRAEAAIVAIQGSLIVARGLEAPDVFLRVIESLRRDYLRIV